MIVLTTQRHHRKNATRSTCNASNILVHCFGRSYHASNILKARPISFLRKLTTYPLHDQIYKRCTAITASLNCLTSCYISQRKRRANESMESGAAETFLVPTSFVEGSNYNTSRQMLSLHDVVRWVCYDFTKVLCLRTSNKCELRFQMLHPSSSNLMPFSLVSNRKFLRAAQEPKFMNTNEIFVFRWWVVRRRV